MSCVINSPKYPSHHWIQVRLELYRQVYDHVQLILGKSQGHFRTYEKTYESEFSKKWRPSDRQELLVNIEEASIVLMGDFHALHQSQKAHLRLLKSIPGGKGLNEKIHIGVECVEARHQKILDRFVDGKISEREFLKAVEWKKSWGFPWENYRPFFRWAQKNRVRVHGLNVLSQSLKRRDQFAAKRIAQIYKTEPRKKIIVIYGDLHLADRHLVAEMKKTSLKPLRPLTIFQNSEKIYFQMLEREMEDKVDVVRLGPRKFCLQNVPPWVKWQNYLLFLEEHFDKNLDDELDLTDIVAQYVKLVSQDLGLSGKTDHFSVMSAQDRNFWQQLEQNLSHKELQFIESWVEQGRSFYIPQLSLGFLARSSVNNASQLAMAVVAADMSSLKKIPYQMPLHFTGLIWLEAIQYFGSKLVNPKRKTDTLTDIKNQLSAANPDDQGKAAMRLALSQKMFELMHLSGARKSRESFKKNVKIKAYQEAAKILGGILGEKMYFGYRQKMISRATLVALFKKSVVGDHFQDIYWEILETIENLPEPFKSKLEKI
jgi:hypothetical protein